MSESGRSYARRYERVRRRQHYEFIEAAVERSGGRVFFSSAPSEAPLFLGFEDNDGQRVGICAYVFMATNERIRNRPPDEHRFQIRYGDVNDRDWRLADHPVGFDPLGVDVTMVAGVHPKADLIIGVDPLIYSFLPLGISVEFKDKQVEAAQRETWYAWERPNRSGVERSHPRAPLGLETLVAFSPERFLDYVRFERVAQSLQLDPPLRLAAALDRAGREAATGLHALEVEFSLPAAQILDLINERHRLGVAVRGGVAERHLHDLLVDDPELTYVRLGTAEGPPDFVVRVVGGGDVKIECKNASPTTLKDGTPKVETQKTRASKGDPASRYYSPDQFDVVAACMYGPWKRWEFRFKRSDRLIRDKRYPDRIAAIQRIDSTWSSTLLQALST